MFAFRNDCDRYLERTMRHIIEAIYSFEIGGSEILAKRLAEEFQSRGAKTTVVAVHKGDGPLRDVLRKAGIASLGLDTESDGLIARLSRARRIEKVFRGLSADTLHAHHVSVLSQCLEPARRAGISRVVLTEHAHVQFERNTKIKQRARDLVKKADSTSVIHEGLHQYFIHELGCDPNKISMIPNGVDTDKFSPKASRSSGEDVFKIGFLGRLNKEKDPLQLIRAFDSLQVSLPSDGPSTQLFIAGDGELRAECEQQVAAADLGAKVHMMGLQNDVVHFLNSVDVLVLSSKSEGVPLVIMEAFSCGVPVIATDVGGVSQLVDDSVGQLVRQGDTQALTDAMAGAAKHRQHWREKGERAREKAVTQYNFQDVADAYWEILDPRLGEA